MKTSPAGIALIEKFEGLRLEAYQDGAGVWTIGYGHTTGVHQGDTCTQVQAEKWLQQDVDAAEAAVASLVTVYVNQNQFDALVSFTFNLGAGHLKDSTLLELVNANRMDFAAKQFSRWDMVGGKASPGLLIRRDAESRLFSQGVTA